MSDYPLIADHGLIGDLQTAALVTADGTVDWFCSPRFDSPSIFASLLDHRKGGYLRVRPTQPSFSTRQLYLPETAVLITRFLTDEGVGELVDFMPVTGEQPTGHHRLVRLLSCVRGKLTFDVDVAPRFDYGRREHHVHVTDAGAVFTAGDMAMTVHAVRDPGDERLAQTRAGEGGGTDLHLSIPLSAGQVRGLVVETGSDSVPRAVSSAEVRAMFDDTVEFWRNWSARSTYRGRWREELLRSAMTLKLMTNAPTGGLVAAPTAGLPENVGGERNWDYRYTWIRDASFSVYSLLRMGFTDEAVGFGQWLRKRVDERAGTEGPLDIMYRVDGSSDLVEEILPHLEGYRGSYPVRIGNGAAGQLQLDIYGEALDSIHLLDKSGQQIGHQGWKALCQVLDWLVDHWDQAEEGIWETRGGRKDFTYGRLMSWVAFDRGIRMANTHGRPADLTSWLTARDAAYEQIMQRGWNPQRGAFVQHYDDQVLDASLLKMPTVGFVAPRDPMWLSTLRAMDEELVADSLVYRYDPEASPDGLRGSEGTFSLCSFMYVDALVRAGRVNDARLVFEKMLTYGNHLGLYAEEVAPNGEQIGNFPQAFTHLALIDAAISLDDALQQGVRPAAARVTGAGAVPAPREPAEPAPVVPAT